MKLLRPILVPYSHTIDTCGARLTRRTSPRTRAAVRRRPRDRILPDVDGEQLPRTLAIRPHTPLGRRRSLRQPSPSFTTGGLATNQLDQLKCCVQACRRRVVVCDKR